MLWFTSEIWQSLRGLVDLLCGLEFLNKYPLNLITRKLHVFAIWVCGKRRKGSISLCNRDINNFFLIVTQILPIFSAIVSCIFPSKPYIVSYLTEFYWSKKQCQGQSFLLSSTICQTDSLKSQFEAIWRQCEYFHWLKLALDQNQRLFQQWVFHHTLSCWVHAVHLPDFLSSSGKYNAASWVNWSLATYFPSIFSIKWQVFKIFPCTQKSKLWCHLSCSICGFCVLSCAEDEHCFIFIKRNLYSCKILLERKLNEDKVYVEILVWLIPSEFGVEICGFLTFKNFFLIVCKQM